MTFDNSETVALTATVAAASMPFGYTQVRTRVALPTAMLTTIGEVGPVYVPEDHVDSSDDQPPSKRDRLKPLKTFMRWFWRAVVFGISQVLQGIGEGVWQDIIDSIGKLLSRVRTRLSSAHA